MDESYSSMLADGVEKKMRTLETDIMTDIVRRVKKTGKITSTADWQISRLAILGTTSSDVKKLIEKAVDGNQEEVERLYADVIANEYTAARPMYEAVGKEFIPYEQNAELQQAVNAMVTQSNEDLFNISKSTGFMLDYNGKKVFTPLSEVYNEYLDDAVMGMVSGAYDYNTMVRRMVNQMTASGLRTDHQFKDGGKDYGIDYPSGHHNRIDVAARRALLTGVSQVAGRITDMNAQKLNTDFFEVTWHAGARPDHATWQGKVYSKEQLKTVCGLGQGGGLLGWNCRHSYYPFIPGVSKRNWSDEWLEEKNAEEAKPTKWKGKEYNTYQATQHQRQLETAMRARREQVQMLREAGADPDDIMNARCRYHATMQEYNAFSRAMNLPTQMERVYTGRTAGRISPSPKAFANWQAEQANKEKERAENRRRKDMDNAAKIRSPINTRNTGKGNATAITHFDVELNNRQQMILDQLPEYNSRATINKGNVSMSDLSALTAKTGDEFALFTRGSERLVIRGNSTSVDVNIDKARELAQNGYRWSGHTHPGTDVNCLTASSGDYEILKAFNQNTSVTYNSLGQFLTYDAE